VVRMREAISQARWATGERFSEFMVWRFG
jgi:hypothetical protein